MPTRASATAFGHSLEPSFLANLALAATSLSQRRLFAPLEAEEQPMDESFARCWSLPGAIWRGEALAVIETA